MGGGWTNGWRTRSWWASRMRDRSPPSSAEKIKCESADVSALCRLPSQGLLAAALAAATAAPRSRLPAAAVRAFAPCVSWSRPRRRAGRARRALPLNGVDVLRHRESARRRLRAPSRRRPAACSARRRRASDAQHERLSARRGVVGDHPGVLHPRGGRARRRLVRRVLARLDEVDVDRRDEAARGGGLGVLVDREQRRIGVANSTASWCRRRCAVEHPRPGELRRTSGGASAGPSPPAAGARARARRRVRRRAPLARRTAAAAAPPRARTSAAVARVRVPPALPVLGARAAVVAVASL